MKSSSPSGDEIIINVDRNGYNLDFCALYRGKFVGFAKCIIQEKRLLLDHIEVADHSRHLSVGSKIIQTMTSKAETLGIHEIFGSVVQMHIDDTPGLLDWYRKKGFTVMEPDQDCLENAVNKVVMKLNECR